MSKEQEGQRWEEISKVTTTSSGAMGVETVERISVPGGWIYKIQVGLVIQGFFYNDPHLQTRTHFVSDPDAK